MRICLPILLALGGCGSTSVSEPTSTLATVHVVGSDTMMSSLLPALAETHQRALGTVHFDLEGGGSGEGFTALIDGRSDLSAAGRPHTPEEQERALEAGFSLEDSASKHVIGVDVLAVAAHPSNALSAMTYDEVIGVFCTGSIDDWSFLGMPEQPIRVLSRAEGSGTRALFEDFFCGPGGLGEHVQVMPLDEIRLTLESERPDLRLHDRAYWTRSWPEARPARTGSTAQPAKYLARYLPAISRHHAVQPRRPHRQ
jgi:ABC-type phosphate transport system substrate-binding protein